MALCFKISLQRYFYSWHLKAACAEGAARSLFAFLFFVIVCRMSHSKAFSQQSKPGRNSHSSNRYVCVVFAHWRDAMKKRRTGRSFFFFLCTQCLGCSPNIHTNTGLSYLPHRGLGWWWWWWWGCGGGGGVEGLCRINTKSSNGAWGAHSYKI